MSKYRFVSQLALEALLSPFHMSYLPTEIRELTLIAR